ncbi:MAG: ligase-associated DNA damage response DEXH box helicase [Caulobacteraceae bacterium]
MGAKMDGCGLRLDEPFAGWFAQRGWSPRPHQLAMAAAGAANRSALLIAPTGAGKTLAGFLPSLIEIANRPPSPTPRGVHTLDLSPLKALAVDVERNLLGPIADMGLDVRAESRTGDTGLARRQRQRVKPPDLLITTPEQLALFLAWEGARRYFEDLRCVIVDEVHALWPSKRGDLLALGLSRLQTFAPGLRRVGLSATVDDPDLIRRWLAPSPEAEVELILGGAGAPPVVEMLLCEGKVPWAGHTARHAMAEVYEAISRARTALVFVNTRFQAEFAFQELWRLNEACLPIALHHGSLAAEQRRKVEAAMARGALRAVVCTSTLDLGVDWGDVDLVIQLASPKGASRMVQRIGRANHRLDEPSRALFVPANRFEMLECQAAREAIAENALDSEPERAGALDVLAQHLMGLACSEPVDLLAVYDEVRAAGPYRDLSWEDFEAVVDFVSTGGYALRSYDRYRRIVKGLDGVWRVRNEETALRHRMNVGAIVSPAMLSVRIAGSRRGTPGRKIGEVEEGYLEVLEAGDTFVFAGQVWRLVGLSGLDVLVRPAPEADAKMPSWGGSKFALSTFLAAKVRRLMSDGARWDVLPADTREWLEAQRDKSAIPAEDEMLLETFPRGRRHFMVAYPFEGRLAHTTLAMLLTRRLERAGAGPLGFVCNDYAVAVWSLEPMDDLDFADLFAEDMLGDDLESWLLESAMMKGAFKACALVSGLVERRFRGDQKSGRQITFSTDLVYDVLRRHQPDHLLLRCARADAARGLVDVARLGQLLARIKGRIRHARLDHLSPFAVPMVLEIGKQRSPGGAGEMMLAEAAEALIAEAVA